MQCAPLFGTLISVGPKTIHTRLPQRADPWEIVAFDGVAFLLCGGGFDSVAFLLCGGRFMSDMLFTLSKGRTGSKEKGNQTTKRGGTITWYVMKTECSPLAMKLSFWIMGSDKAIWRLVDNRLGNKCSAAIAILAPSRATTQFITNESEGQ